MYSIAFPKMVGNTNTVLVKDRDATASNLKLLLMSDKTSLLGDPYFGANLKKIIFEQNSVVLRDLIIDDIYTAIQIFLPQIIVNRADIDITSDGVDVFINIKCLNVLDFTQDLYIINLTSEEE